MLGLFRCSRALLVLLYWLVEESIFKSLLTFLIAKADELIFHRSEERGSIKKVLVYSPNLGGHRHIHCKRFIDFFRSKNLEVCFVFCGIITDQDLGTYASYRTKYIDSYDRDRHVHLIDIADELKNSSEKLDLIVRLQTEYDADLTLLIDGDELKRSLAKQILPWKPKLVGRNYGIFIRSEFMYPAACALPDCNWRADKFFYLLLFNRFSLLDGGFFFDENIVEKMDSGKYIHLAEVGNARLDNDENSPRSSFYADVEKRYLEFLQKHKDKDVILCFGDLENRKGFDYMLQLVCDNDDLILVRTGRTKPGYHATWQSVFNKEQLIMEDRLFDLDLYVLDQGLIDTLYESTKYILLPYKHFYRTSGAMLQALAYTKPVLVPDTGLFKHRVENNKLGRTYQHLSYSSFQDEFSMLREEYEIYTESIRDYVREHYSTESFNKICERMLRQCTLG